MKTCDSAVARQFRQRLMERASELRGILRDEATAAAVDYREVMDFKDVATQETLAAVDEVQAASAAHELQQVLGALGRVADGSYGQCIDCGDAIDLRRLDALPATPCCTACQSVHERLRA